jgi:hypothetical protein
VTHLTATELLDVAEDPTRAAGFGAHLESCDTCRIELEHLTRVLHDLRVIDVPDPSPLFWKRFSTRVHEAIEAEQITATGLPRWLRWPVLVPLGSLALLIVALTAIVAPRAGQHVATPTIVNNSAATPAETDGASAADTAWLLITEAVGSLDFDEAEEAGISTGPGAADEAVLQLSAAEQQELVRLLQQELAQPGG